LAARGRGTDEVARSLESLCEQYWPPLYAFVRHRGHLEHDAQDLTQAFFAKLLEKDWLRGVDPARGRFRAFLLMALKRFLSKDREHTNAQKRGGGLRIIPLDAEFVCLLADTKASSPESVFDRQWALTVLQVAMSRLQKEYADSNRSGDFERLKECLTAERGTIDYATLASELGVRPVSARSSVHRMRARFRELFREEVTGTVADPADVEDEMRALFDALSGH
jgi:RNA polymerase sigma-70 factor (ECF subfamily)